ncbi:hypothetical protein SLEP1_g28607 [Rubroshorea leprosula]|uniref:UspA domain-containing protein n=1 Tax=Rubroshorea leprosula TaxID=152421 RepID=A0AAV5JU61_9ROSI|nr:hypothetical protein SLEP1_g28607 [Rubroshorea leprosula]
MIVAIDDNEHSAYALEWMLDHFFVLLGDSALFKLVIVHTKPSTTSAVGLAGPSSYSCGFQYFYLLILSRRIAETSSSRKKRFVGSTVSFGTKTELV